MSDDDPRGVRAPDPAAGQEPPEQAEPDARPGPDDRAGPDERDAQLEQLRSRVAQLEDRYTRALADLDNYRKRSAREIDRRVEESRERLVRDWLDVLDSVERALRMDAPGASLQQGMQAVLGQLEGTLARHGVRRIGEAGEPFDPELHEAVAVRESTEVPDRSVLEVVRSGFAIGDRVLRPAQVVVARDPAAAS